jgi:hypothetical protein
MFGFTLLEMESTGSAERFPIRIENFKKKKKALPLLQHGFWWFVHNCITHPMIGICPIKPLFEFHDWTSVKLTAGTPAVVTEIEELEDCERRLLLVMKDLIRLNGGEDSYASALVESACAEVMVDAKRYRKGKDNFITRRRRVKKEEEQGFIFKSEKRVD